MRCRSRYRTKFLLVARMVAAGSAARPRCASLSLSGIRATGPALSDAPGRQEVVRAIETSGVAGGYVIGTYERARGSEPPNLKRLGQKPTQRSMRRCPRDGGLQSPRSQTLPGSRQMDRRSRLLSRGEAGLRAGYALEDWLTAEALVDFEIARAETGREPNDTVSETAAPPRRTRRPKA